MKFKFLLHSFALLFILGLSMLTQESKAQCTFANDFESDLTPTSVGDTQTDICVFSNDYVSVNVVNGVQYTFSTCNDTDDTQLTLFNSSNTALDIAFNDDGCGLQSSITWIADFTGTAFLQVNRFNCQTASGGCIEVDVTQDTAPPGPANDDPCNAIALTPGVACSFSTHTTTGATDSPGVPAPGCASYNGGDVWFEVTVPASGHLIFDSDNIDFTDGGMAIYSGTCGSLALIECDDDASANGNMPLIDNNTLTPGSTIFIRFWEFGNNEDGQFDICVQDGSPAPPPANDDPCNAIAITSGSACSFGTYTNVGATSSAGVPAPGCANYSGGDVWFQATVPASGHLVFETEAAVGGSTNMGMAIYSGTCGSLTLIECDDNDSPYGATMPGINNNGLTPGSTVFIRMWDDGNNDAGGFNLCVYEPVDNTSCGSMAPVCTSNAISFTALSTGAAASVTDPGNDYGCLSSQPRPTWYYFEIDNPGNIDFDITAASDIDFALWGDADLPTAQAACGSLPAPIDCSFSASPTEQANIVGANTGDVYVMVVTNYSGATQVVTMQQVGGIASTDCSIVTCAANAGTATPAMGNGSSNNYVLCDNESMTITSDDNYVLPPSPDLRGLGYAIYACAPTTGDPSTDPCFTGYYFTGEDLTETNDVNNLYDFVIANPSPGAGASGVPSGQTLFFAPITMDDIARIADGGSDDNLGHDIDGDGCFDQGAAIEVNYLDPITQNTSEDCGAGTVTITLSGGYPGFEPTASYTVTATGTGTLTQSGSQGATLTFASVTPGGTINISVTDDSNGCTFTYSYNSTCSVPVPCDADAGTW